MLSHSRFAYVLCASLFFVISAEMNNLLKFNNFGYYLTWRVLKSETSGWSAAARVAAISPLCLF